MIVYAKDKTVWRSNFILRLTDVGARYKNPDNDLHNSWKSEELSVQRVVLKGICAIIHLLVINKLVIEPI
ncbi:hypothetical protein [Bartonella koehlerae]|uniref:hypothetical protein n=1 Tax=Bartonella koehlerae TaxID=92181 RepID=UPI0012B66E3C|nr:hypothetical protein [Bartonella koehlerae]